MTSVTEFQSRAVIETDAAARYLQQLCKHFAHKIPVRFDETQGEIAFEIGSCGLSATAGRLELVLRTQAAQDLHTLEDVVARHLLRFAFRDDLTVAWQPV